jgi:hypothetical protein
VLRCHSGQPSVRIGCVRGVERLAQGLLHPSQPSEPTLADVGQVPGRLQRVAQPARGLPDLVQGVEVVAGMAQQPTDA